jgi:hypothetical protein
MIFVFGFICLHHDQVLAHCSLITSCAECLARDCMPPIERTDVREGVRKSFPPPPELCITQVPLICLDFISFYILNMGQMIAQVFASSDLESLPSAEAMSFACIFLGNMCAT